MSGFGVLTVFIFGLLGGGTGFFRLSLDVAWAGLLLGGGWGVGFGESGFGAARSGLGVGGTAAAGFASVVLWRGGWGTDSVVAPAVLTAFRTATGPGPSFPGSALVEVVAEALVFGSDAGVGALLGRGLSFTGPFVLEVETAAGAAAFALSIVVDVTAFVGALTGPGTPLADSAPLLVLTVATGGVGVGSKVPALNLDAGAGELSFSDSTLVDRASDETLSTGCDAELSFTVVGLGAGAAADGFVLSTGGAVPSSFTWSFLVASMVGG